MNKMRCLLTATLLTCAATNVSANEPGAYAGVKLGYGLIDVQGIDNGFGYGVYAGYEFSEGLMIELERTDYSTEIDNTSIDFDVNTTALYFGHRYAHSDDIYFKFKVGMLYEYMSASTGDFEVEYDKFNASYGVGAGYKLNDLMFELEYTVIESDASALTLGVVKKF